MKTFDQGQHVEVRTTIHDDDDWKAARYESGAGGYHAVYVEDAWYIIVVLDDEIRAVRKTPAEWEKIDNITVIDPDGWDQSNLGESWEIPLDRETWERCVAVSTVVPGRMADLPASEFVLVNNENIYKALVKREAELLAELVKIQEKKREFEA